MWSRIGLIARTSVTVARVIRDFWSVDRTEYRPGTAMPRYSCRYHDGEDLAAGEWYNRTSYDEDGRATNVEWREGDES
jgi:hypothetical protein